MKFRIIVQGLIVPLFIVSCNSENNEKNKIEEYRVASPIVVDTIFNQEYVADIQAVKNVEIRSRINGFIDNIHVDEGQFVKEGQLLFSISAQEYNDALMRSKAQLKNVQAELKSLNVELRNVKNLFAKGIVSKSEVELAETKVEAAEAKCEEIKSEVNTAQLNVSFTKIKAPFSGYINRIPNKVGSLVEEGAMLTTISDNQEVFAYFRVSEFEYLNFMRNKGLKNQKDVQLILADNSIHKELGLIETVDGEIDRSTGNVAFRARFKNPQKLLKHGASGKICIGMDLKKAILVPMSATFEIQENYYVYVVDKDSRIKMRRIYPTVELGDHYAVSKGLTKSDQILLEGTQLVKDGQQIKIKN